MTLGQAPSTRGRDLFQLIRPRLSAMVASAAVSGYLVAASEPLWRHSLYLAAGVFLLTAAASAFNQVQEREIDLRLPRTRHRPVACGRLAPRSAVGLATVMMVVGGLTLAQVAIAGTWIGLAAVAWYNLLYTPLKQRSSLALLVGALGGAAAPLLGWVASGASPFEPRAVHLYLLLVLWQIPHFCCLSLKDGLHCQQTGLRILPRHWSVVQIVRQIRLWSLGFAVLTLSALPLALLESLGARLTLAVLCLWGLWSALITRPEGDVSRWAHLTGHRLQLTLGMTLILFPLDPLFPF